MAQKVLVVCTAPFAEDVVRALVVEHSGAEAEMLIVAPASKISRLDWLTNAEDDARAEAEARAERVADQVPTDAVQTQVGDSNPIQAIEDALRTFPADELVIVTQPDEEATWLEEGSGDAALTRFSLPVTHLVVAS